ncbi:MAG: hypothetical protein K2O45_11495 [Oscillospiraceae bacterium]|nr:hypothetical protein [Oscillospiraceae bacterium]
MSSREIALWVDERWYQALSRQLKDETVEGRLNSYLDELIDQLPEHVRGKISNEIWVEQQKQKQEIEDSKKYSVFRVTEDGVTKHFQVEQAVDMLEAASCVRRWLRQAEHHPFQEMLSGRENISAEIFDRMAVGCVEGDRKITGVYDVNLDAQKFSAVRPDLGWITYRLKDVSTASWHSYRTGSYDKERRQARFTEKLAGKEITSAGHLSAKNFAFADEITADGGRLNFYLENSFDVDRVLGTRTAKGDDWLNVYASYDMAAGQVCDMLEVDLHRADGREESLEYRLNAVEKATLLRKMDAYCQQQTGQSLTDYSAQCMAEDMAPPAGPVM